MNQWQDINMLCVFLTSICSFHPDRQALGKITKDGVFIEELERNPGRFLPEVSPTLN